MGYCRNFRGDFIMNKTRDKIIIGIISIVLGIIMSMQFKAVQNNFLGGLTPVQSSKELMAELSQLKIEKEDLIKEYQELENKLASIEDAESKDNLLIKSLNEDLSKYKRLAGYESMVGQGIEVSIDNPPKEMNFTYEVNLVYEYELILKLINELNAAGAEAISINDERVINITAIRTAGNNLMVNSIPQLPPFTVKAIGNKDTLDGAINQVFGIVSQFRDRNYQVNVRKIDEVIVPKANGIIKFKYAKTVEE